MNPISPAAVLRRSLGIWAKNLAPFLLLTLLVTLPSHVLHYVMETGQLTTGDANGDAALLFLLDTVLINIAAGAIAWGVYQALRGQPIEFVRCVLVGLERLPRVVAVGFVGGAIIFIGLIALIVPGVFLACVLYVAVPVAILEGGGVTTALVRSATLTAGNRLQIFLVALISFAVSYGVGILVVEAIGENVRALWTARVVLFVASASFGAVTNTVAYHDLRVAREGRTPEDVASTFE